MIWKYFVLWTNWSFSLAARTFITWISFYSFCITPSFPPFTSFIFYFFNLTFELIDQILQNFNLPFFFFRYKFFIRTIWKWWIWWNGAIHLLLCRLFATVSFILMDNVFDYNLIKTGIFFVFKESIHCCLRRKDLVFDWKGFDLLRILKFFNFSIGVYLEKRVSSHLDSWENR